MPATACPLPTPARPRKALPEALRYVISPCPLGLLLMAASEHGVCALLFADDEQSLLDELQRRFPGSELQQDPNGLQPWLQAVLQRLQNPSQPADVPLDLRGSAFQQRVWLALLAIPPGQTLRYGELATRLGSHARAVARACASNPIGLLVPCHRVVGADQALTGYRWGVARKAALLASERSRTGA